MTEGEGDWKGKRKGKTLLLTTLSFKGVPESEQ